MLSGHDAIDDNLVFAVADFVHRYGDTDTLLDEVERLLTTDQPELLVHASSLISAISEYDAAEKPVLRNGEFKEVVADHLRQFKAQQQAAQQRATELWQHYQSLSNRLDYLPLDSEEYKQLDAECDKTKEAYNKASEENVWISLWNGVIVGPLAFRNEYDGHTIDKSLEQVSRIYGRKIRILAGDRGYRGQQMSGDTKVIIPDVPKASDTAYTRAAKHKLFRKRAGIEPVIGHCKSDHRLGQNFYKGLFGDSINVMLAAAAFNLKRAMDALLCLIWEYLLWLFLMLEYRVPTHDRVKLSSELGY